MASVDCVVMQSLPHMYVQGCVAHCLDLLLQDWSNEKQVKILVKKARIIYIFIMNHHASQAIFRRLSPNLAICMLVETRFVTNFNIINRLLQMRDALERMVVDADWHMLVEDLKKKNLATYEKCIMVRYFVCSNGYWCTC
jgi:hypothetical protein